MAYGKTALFSLTKTYASSANQACMVAMTGAYHNPVFVNLANAKNNNNFQKIRMTTRETKGAYINAVEVYIGESSTNNYDVFLQNQSVISGNDIIYETVPFLPAEEGAEVIGAEQDL